MTFRKTPKSSALKSKVLVPGVIIISLAFVHVILGGEKPPADPTGEKDLSLKEIRILTQQRDLGKGRLLKMLTSKNAETRRAAAVALGWIRKPRALIDLGFRIGREKDPKVLQAMLFSIGQISSEAAEQLAEKHPDRVPAFRAQISRRSADPLRELLAREDVEIPGGNESRALAVEALGKTGLSNESVYILPALSHESAVVRAHAIRALVRTDPKPHFKEIAKLVSDAKPGVSGIASWAIATLLYRDRVLRKMAGQPVKAALVSTDPWTRYYGYIAARRALMPELVSAVVKAAGKEKASVLKISAARALAQFPGDEKVAEILKGFLSDSNQNVRAEAVYAAGDLGDEFLIQEALGLLKKETNLEVKAAILKVHAQRNGSKALKLIEPYVVDKDVNFRIRMAECLGLIGDDASLKLMKFLRTDTDPRVTAAVLRALVVHSIRVDEAYSMAKEALKVPNAAVKYEALLVLYNARKEWANQLIAAQYSRCHEAKYRLVRLLILKLVQRDFEEKHIPLFRIALADPDPEVRVAARDFFRNRLGREEEIEKPYNNLRTFLEIPMPGTRFEMITTQGPVMIETLPESAPAHAAAFKALVERQFYDRIIFHKVKPGVLVETGDPLGVGLGGPEFFVPDEVNRLEHQPAMVGFSDRGPDTGGSQIYFCLAPLPELDGRFTVFAKVVEGMSTLLDIQFGDRILSIRKISKKEESEK